jgi:GH15 family glucan-1,4-alpha-glucosidase
MDKIYQSVKTDNFRLDEQIDRDSGNQKSAQSLTWSYANVLRALKTRNGINNFLLNIQ